MALEAKYKIASLARNVVKELGKDSKGLALQEDDRAKRIQTNLAAQEKIKQDLEKAKAFLDDWDGVSTSPVSNKN